MAPLTEADFEIRNARPSTLGTAKVWRFEASVCEPDGQFNLGEFTVTMLRWPDQGKLWLAVRTWMCERYGHNWEGPNGPLAPDASCARCGVGAHTMDEEP